MDPVQEQNQKEPTFTIIILVTNFEHLLPVTLDSILSQTEQDFQIVLVESQEFSKIEHIMQSYAGVSIELHVENEGNLAILLNRGLGYAKGKYIHYLYCGDVYLSQHSLSYLKSNIEKNQDPDILYCGYLIRDPDTPPSVMMTPLTIEQIRKGDLPTMWQCWWFLKSRLEKSGGFDEGISHRPIFNYVCQMVKGSSKIVFLPQILVDYIPYRTNPRMSMRFMFQTFKVIFRQFGLWRAFLWWFLQDHVRTIKMSLRILKKAFWGT